MPDPQLPTFTDGIRLDGRVALITGVASGMGRAMALALAAGGADIAGFDIDAALLQQLATHPVFISNRSSFIGIVGDVSNSDDCARAVNETVARFGGLHILVNCAGVSIRVAAPADIDGMPRFWEVVPDGLERLLAINAHGPLLMARFAAPLMIAGHWGRIINISTSFDTMLRPGFSAYGASKAAVEASTASWAQELQDTGVTANVLVPGGMTDTPFLQPAMRAGALPPEVMQAPVRWLASDRSDGVTGCRFVAQSWDTTLPPDEAAARISAPAAWPGEAAKATATRGS